MRLLVYDMLVNVNGIYYVHVCEQARWARSAGNIAIENVCINIINTLRKNCHPIVGPSPSIISKRQLQVSSTIVKCT